VFVLHHGHVSPLRQTPARLAVLGLAVTLLTGLGVPLATGAAAAAKGPCGQSWTVKAIPSYAIFPARTKMTIYKAPTNSNLKVLKTIKDPMPDGTRGVLLAFDATVTKVPGWLYVVYGARSNKATGWVKLKDAQGIKNKYAIEISRRYHKLAVVKSDGTCFGVFPVAVGAPASPTPAGLFFVNDKIKAPNAAYGHVLLGTSAASPTYVKFDNLDAAIGIHGTNEPASVGKSVSHGCIRLRIADSDKINPRINSGTPIVIT
jgi:lipoprotein-anchoring transpeptidase ErfK/SrfK